MDSSEMSWLSEMGLDNSIFMDQCDFMDSFDEEVAAVLGQDFENCLSAGNNSSSSSTLINIPSTNSINSLCTNSPPTDNNMASEPPAKLQKPNNFSNFSTVQTLPNPDRASSAPIILNFGNSTEINPQQIVNPSRPLNPDEEAAVSEVLRSQGSFVEPEEQPKRAPAMTATTKKTSRVRPPSQTYDHIIAERKRREQLSQRFVALSTIVPGLKKIIIPLPLNIDLIMKILHAVREIIIIISS
ncbi:hypothetical protein CDL12_03663 [Handroanthus impetiginosus]|uniref:BHLH domain-containing protein n=1 Tax=Handroanthus impetiginosus TaxID=429701 RepID=A0A2G9I1I8_9LAMI|nr:hypothetical protein CDL12_03663 [Handroanthus impetiginosus]